MTAKRFTTNGYYIYDHYKGNEWLVNEVEAIDITNEMNNLDTKARENAKALSKAHKENQALKQEIKLINQVIEDFTKINRIGEKK